MGKKILVILYSIDPVLAFTSREGRGGGHDKPRSSITLYSVVW